MYRDTSSVDYAPRELTHACSRSDTCSDVNSDMQVSPSSKVRDLGGVFD